MLVVSHRGFGFGAPENTLLAFQRAIDAGMERAELDVMLTSDGVPVVIHGQDVHFETDGTGMINEMTLEEIKKLNCKEGQKIPTLEEVVKLCKGKIILQIELKWEGTPKATVDLLRRYEMVDDVVITSFQESLIREMRALDKNIKVGLLFRGLNGMLDLADLYDMFTVGIRGGRVNKRMVDGIHGRGRKVYAFGVNEESLFKNLISMGVDEIGTDYPVKFKELYEQTQKA